MKKIYLIATVTALIAGLATYFFANQIAANSKLSDVEKCQVVVAKVEIAANTVITPEMVEVQSIPVALAVSKFETEWGGDVATLTGRMTVVKLSPGEQILRKDTALIGGSGETIVEGEASPNTRLSYELAAGEYAYSMSINSESATDYYMREGDYVYIYFRDSSEGTVTVSPLFGDGVMVKILKLNAYSANKSAKASGAEIETYSTVTLLLNREQLETMLQAKVSSGELVFVLVPQVEVAEAEGQPVDSIGKQTFNAGESTTAAEQPAA